MDNDFFQVIKIKEKVFGWWLRIAKCYLQTVLSLKFHEMCPICRTAGSTEKLETQCSGNALSLKVSIFQFGSALFQAQNTQNRGVFVYILFS